jgi:hypothetical protein
MSNEPIRGWKSVPFRVVNLYFLCSGMVNVKPSWHGLRDFVNRNPHLMKENAA